MIFIFQVSYAWDLSDEISTRNNYPEGAVIIAKNIELMSKVVYDT